MSNSVIKNDFIILNNYNSKLNSSANMSSSYDFDYLNKASEANSCKKAIIVVAFFTYLLYIAINGGIYYM